MSVELIYDAVCPNVSKTRTQLLRAFVAIGSTPNWLEWERSSPDSPGYVRGYLSPTLLIDGRDIAEAQVADNAGEACRVYSNETGRLQAFPSLASIQNALRRSFDPGKRPDWESGLSALPAIGFSLLPKLTCPLCWPAYAALLSALGLGFVDYTPYLFQLTAVFLAFTLVLLGAGAKHRRGYGPLLLGAAASAVVLTGKFAYDSNVALYFGVALLVGASPWNAWPKRSSTSNCPAWARAERI